MLWQVVLKHFKSPIASVNIRQPQKACHRFLGFVMTRSCKRVGVQACKCAKVRSYKRRVQLLSIIGSAGTLPSRKFAVSLFANRYSPLAAVLMRRKNFRQRWRAHLLMRRKFSAVRERCPPENSLLATRCLSTFTICR
jgi:hypothetical protein